MMRIARKTLLPLLGVAASAACNFTSDPVLGVEGMDWEITPARGGGSGIAIDPDGNVVVAGTSWSAEDEDDDQRQDAWLGKFDSAGREIWTSRFGGERRDFAYDVAADNEANLFVVGTEEVLGNSRAFVRKLDSDGTEIWARTAGGGVTGRDRAQGVATDAGGNAFVAGAVDVGDYLDFDADPWLRKYDPDGNELWTVTVPGGDDFAYGVATDPQGDAIIVGQAEVEDGQDWVAFMRKYDADGNELWASEFEREGDNAAIAVATDDGGNIYSTGNVTVDQWSEEYGTESHRVVAASIRKLDPDGVELWSQTFEADVGTPGDDPVAMGFGIAPTPEGGAFVVGYASEGAGGDIWIGRYGSDGEPISTRRIDCPRGGDDQGAGVAIDGSGRFYATGHLCESPAEIWIARFDE